MLRTGARRGLFLPEVWKKLPDKERFLGELCRQKLGLPYDACKSADIDVYTFKTQTVQEG